MKGLLVLLGALLMPPEDSVVWTLKDIHVTPEKPLAKIGSSLILNCTTSCSLGKATWKILEDSFSASYKDYGQFNIVNITSVTKDLSLECSGNCGRRTSRTSVTLYYFSPVNIAVDPKEPAVGQQFQIKCEVEVHPDVRAELKLNRGDTVMTRKDQCEETEQEEGKHCELSATDQTQSREVQYECEVTLQVGSSHHTETSSLQLRLKEAAVTSHPPAKTSAPAELQSTAGLDAFPTQQSDTPSSTVSQEAALTSHPPVKMSATAELQSTAGLDAFPTQQSDTPSSTVSQGVQSTTTTTTSLAVILGVLGVLGVLLVMAALFRRRKKCQESECQEGQTHPPQCL